MAAVLHYFDAWGRAERIRWILIANDIEYTDRKYVGHEWLAVRSIVEFGQLPIMEIDGHILVQSLAIEGYIWRKIDHSPIESSQLYLVQSTLLAFDDWFRHFANFLIYTNDLDGYIKYFHEELKLGFKCIEKRLEENGNNGYVVGNSRTLADFAIAEFIYDFFLSTPRKNILGPLITSECPKLVEFTNSFIQSYPKLNTYLSTRPDRNY